MQKRMNFRGRWVLITGASSGLGLEMARVFARDHKANLVLVARRAERLQTLREELVGQYGVEIACIPADLAHDTERVFAEATSGRDVYAAILNAGITFYGKALEMPHDAFQAMLTTNVVSPVRLTNLFVSYWKDRGIDGGVMLVSSMAGFMPMPYQAAYGATKAFLTNYGQSLSEEIRGSGISITVFAPGGIATEMLELSGLSRKFKPGALGIMAAQLCAEHAVRAFAARRELYVPGGLNQITALVTKLAPRRLVLGQVARMYREGT